MTDGSGRFEVKVPAGEIRVYCPGTKATKTITTRSGEVTEVELLPLK